MRWVFAAWAAASGGIAALTFHDDAAFTAGMIGMLGVSVVAIAAAIWHEIGRR